MKVIKSLSRVVVACGFALAATAVAQTKWDMPTPYPDAIFHTENVRHFATNVEKATSGKLKIVVHSNASLFKANEIKRAVQGGQAQIGEIIISGYANEDPMYGIDSVPFFATSYAESAKLAKAWRKVVDARLAKQGLKVLYSVPWPPQGLYTNTPINSVADMKGLKMRAYNPAITRIAQLVGAQPMTIQASEVVQALATGIVNANFTSGASGYDQKAWETSKYFYDLQAWLPHNIVLVSQKAFDALDKPTQEAVLKAAADAEARGTKISEEKAKWYVNQLTLHGMKVVSPSPELKAELKKIGDQMIAEWLKTTGADGKGVVDEFRK